MSEPPTDMGIHASPPARKKRPTGVTIIAVLDIIISIFLIFIGLILIAVVIAVPLIDLVEPGAKGDVEIWTMLLAIIGGLLLAVGITAFVVAFAMLRGKGWAWSVNVIIAFIDIGATIAVITIEAVQAPDSIVESVYGTVFSIAINVIILWYLYTPNVKEFFGKIGTSATIT